MKLEDLRGTFWYKVLKIWNNPFNPFGNYDRPLPHDWYLPDKPLWLRLLAWYFARNILHNFDYYWIGTARYPSRWNVWHDKRSWNLILPFFSYRGSRFRFYIGWRPKGDGSQIFGFRIIFKPKEDEG